VLRVVQRLERGNPFNFRASTASVYGLKKAGFDVLTLANNHILDGGFEGLRDTIDILKQHRILYCGAGDDLDSAVRPAVMKIKGKTVAVISCTTLYPKV